MTPEYFKNKSTKELEEEFKKTKIVLKGLILFLSILLAIVIFIFQPKMTKAVFISVLVVVCFCFVTLPYQYKMLRKLKKEISKRNIK